MRFNDLIRLAFAALWQQKLRTVLTTLGVLFGSFVLLASFAVRIGVDERIVEESARFRQLREIRVYSGEGEKPSKPVEKINVVGKMSDARRERLRADIKRYREWYSPAETRSPITLERVNELRKLPHVHAVRPLLTVHCRAVLGKSAEYVQVLSATPGQPGFAERVIAGTYLTGVDTQEVVVSEYLLYRLGVVDEADVDNAIGRTLRVEYQGRRPNPGLLATLLSGGQGNRFQARDEEFMAKVVKQLSKSLAKLDLKPDELAKLRRMLKPPAQNEQNRAESNVVGEFRIAGVVRSPSEEEMTRRMRWQEIRSDLFLPADAMAKFLFQVPRLRSRGFENVVVEVDDIQNVKSVTEAIKATGLNAHSSLRAVEHQQAIYGLIFSAMTVVALIALLVAALGITNTMIMSVLERVRQIGIMKAVGARNGHIQAIFLIEGALIGLVGGVFGTAIAYFASGPADDWVQSMVQRDMSVELHGSIFAFPWPLLIGVPLFSMVVTTVSAFFPARRAAKVDPVTALRHE